MHIIACQLTANLRNLFVLCFILSAALPSIIKQQRGQIIFINSIQGVIGIPFRSAYAASKHALLAFTDSLRAEVHSSNVDVMSVIVGYVRTSLSLNAITGTGQKYAKMDPNTEKGYDPAYVAQQIVSSAQQRKKEIVVSAITPRVAIWLRKHCPSLYFYVMAKRAASAQKA